MSDQIPQDQNELPQRRVQVKMPDREPIVTYSLIGLSVLFFIGQTLLQTLTGNDILFAIGGKVNPLIMQGQFWRLITPVLLHGSILHIALNMYALYIIGRRLEKFYGHGRFLLLYLLSGFAGNVLSFVLTPAPSLGASTAIFGLFSAEGIFIYQNRKMFGQARTQQALLNLVVILIINLSYGFMSGTNIDNMGHIGGVIGGIFFAWKGGPVLKVTGQQPFLDLRDDRKKSDVWLASLVVLIGFSIIAAIPFLTS